MYTEIVKIIEGGMIGDKEKVYNYARVLAENLEKTGDIRLSRRIRSLLSSRKPGMLALDAFASKPVDIESRMEMVDISYPDPLFEKPLLAPYVEDEIDSFVQIFHKRDEILQAGIDSVYSLLLYGPPGCGKTTTAQYISVLTELPLLTVRLDGLISSLLGSTAKNIRKVFDFASKQSCILFLDEFDVIAKLRDDKHELGELKRVVNSLLQNIDSFSHNNILIAATNHHELLDHAVWRRFSKIICLDRPDEDRIKKLAIKFLDSARSGVVTNKRKLDEFAAACVGMSHADIKTVINNAVTKAIIEGRDLVESWELLREVYLYRNHRVISDDDFIEFLLEHGVVQREIHEGLGYSLRKIREISKKLS